mmetsp:Transcript_12722/g.34400  ORF Transcript_12722/g.34400 Transcript_12722/m.34400 type:complete len:210 (+) Transcript_12722:1305-1934(+)
MLLPAIQILCFAHSQGSLPIMRLASIPAVVCRKVSTHRCHVYPSFQKYDHNKMSSANVGFTWREIRAKIFANGFALTPRATHGATQSFLNFFPAELGSAANSCTKPTKRRENAKEAKNKELPPPVEMPSKRPRSVECSNLSSPSAARSPATRPMHAANDRKPAPCIAKAVPARPDELVTRSSSPSGQQGGWHPLHCPICAAARWGGADT